MPVLNKGPHSLLFIHVPKAGGTSIVTAFRDNGWNVADYDTSPVHDRRSPNWLRKSSPQHRPAELLSRLYHLDRFDGIFMFVREPFERLKSEFGWQLKRGKIKPSRNLSRTFDSWWQKKYQELLQDASIDDSHLRPQVDFHLSNALVGRLETELTKDFLNSFLEARGLDSLENEIPKSNVTQSRTLVLSSRSAQQFLQFYRRDYETFGYSLPPDLKAKRWRRQ